MTAPKKTTADPVADGAARQVLARTCPALYFMCLLLAFFALLSLGAFLFQVGYEAPDSEHYPGTAWSFILGHLLRGVGLAIVAWRLLLYARAMGTVGTQLGAPVVKMFAVQRRFWNTCAVVLAVLTVYAVLQTMYLRRVESDERACQEWTPYCTEGNKPRTAGIHPGRHGMAIDTYDALARAVTAAGFFTNGVEDHGTWHRTCVCSKKRPDGDNTGNSFWLSRLPSGWYLGTWGPHLYRLPDESRLAELCVHWLTRVPHGTRPDFDEQLKAEFGLILVAEEEFDRKAGIV
jgi:hypothetical protein